jgi:hypothetical protein
VPVRSTSLESEFDIDVVLKVLNPLVVVPVDLPLLGLVLEIIAVEVPN